MPTETKDEQENDGSGGWPLGMEVVTQTVGTPGGKPVSLASDFAADFLEAIGRGGYLIFNPELIADPNAIRKLAELTSKAYILREG